MSTKILLSLCCLLFLATGCSYLGKGETSSLSPTGTSDPAMEQDDSEVMAVHYHGYALYNFQLGRGYMAGGRYELARERFLLALASAENDALRRDAVSELEIVDRLIRSQR